MACPVLPERIARIVVSPAWRLAEADGRAKGLDSGFLVAWTRGLRISRRILDLCPYRQGAATGIWRFLSQGSCVADASGFGLDSQLPITRAIQRDEEAIECWRVDVWPELLRRARRERRKLVFTDESGFYLLPAVVRTYGPKGETPVMYHWATRDHLSVMGAVTTGQRIYTLVRRKAFNGLHCIEFFKHLLRQLARPLLVIWDGSPIHRRTEVKEFIQSMGEKQLVVEPLPAYAPDLNPVEWLWKHLKHVELRNRTCLDLEELHLEFHLALGRVRQKPKLITTFFKGAELPLKP